MSPNCNKLLQEKSDRNQMLELAPCNLCGADDAEFQFDVDRFTIVRCKICGFLYINPRIRREELETLFPKIYSEEYFSLQRSRSISNKMRSLLSRELAKLRFKRLLNELKCFNRKRKLLDIGCATGEFLGIADKRGYEVLGVDISGFACGIARGRVTPNIFSGTVKQASYEDRFFDVVTMFDVFSHLLNPVEDFLEIRRILKDDGILVFMTGNQDLMPMKWLKDFWGDPLEHSWLLGDSSLKVLLTKTGFELLEAKPVGIASAKRLSDFGMPRKIVRLVSNRAGYFISSEMLVICRVKGR